jgi:antitoxin HicB
MEYPAKFTRDKYGGYVVTFPDVPEAISEGDMIDEAAAMAAEALELALTFYTDEWKDLPAPGNPRRGMRTIAVPALSDAKFRLHSTLRKMGIKKVELARRLNYAPSQVDRLLDIRHASKLAQIEAAFSALGKSISIEVRDRAA